MSAVSASFFSVRVLLIAGLLALAACSDVKLPKVFGDSEVPDEVLKAPRVVPVPMTPQDGDRQWPLLGNVPSRPHDFTPQETIDAAKGEMQNNRDDAERMQEHYQAEPSPFPDPSMP
jgi:hypothetical protein